jgi:hypothetical protein
MIERDLEQLILTRIEMGVRIRKECIPSLFERDGPLATFSGNIAFAVALQLVTGDTIKNLNSIRRIRNAFAHSALPITFITPEVVRELSRLTEGEWMAAEPVSLGKMSADRRKFTMPCFRTIHDLLVSMEVLEECIDNIRDALIAYNRPVPHA